MKAARASVKATASVQGELKALSIDPSIFDPAEREVVEDLILAAIKDAQSRAQAKMQQEMSPHRPGAGPAAGNGAFRG